MTSTLGRSDRRTTPEGNPVEPEQLRILLGTAARVPAVTLALIATLVVTTMVAASSDLTGIYAAIAGSWLALHQVTLTIDGVALGVLPLLPTAVLVWLTARAARSATDAFVALGGRPLDRRNASRIAVATLAGPTVITIVALIVIQDAASVLPVVTPNPAAALAWVTALYLLGAGLGIGARTWRPLSVRYGVPNWLVAAVRPAARAVLGMFAAAGVVTVLGLLWSWTVVGDLIGRGGGVTGAFGLTVLSVLYLPNVLIGAAAVVAGSTVQFGDVTLSLFEATGGDLPALPVLAVIPPGPAAPFWPVLLAVPATVGALLGRYVAQRHLEARARGEYVSSTDAVLTVVAAAALAGATSALATWVAGGPLGIFGVVGGNWWLAGVLVFAWSGLLGLVTSQLLLWREHRLAAAEAARASAAAEESATETAAAENPDGDEPVEEADATPLDEAKALEAGPATPAADVLEAEIVEDGPEGQQDAADAGGDADAAGDAGAPAVAGTERVDPADDERVDVADAELEDAADEPGGSGVTEQDAGAPPERNGDLPEGAAPPKG
ncbi:cell division protein PerM [Rhodococcus aetherivorans]|uniref:cell division protein PerM n=1 Tax=Rhodococcus aetherivorans TaxID=191292 RepID=UPI002949173F|nr:DUF6350 family protein [Rhodococcus aetherivorans]MDV6292852.1 DUF6350 family protein [Rhodococcus aetherivorans]